MTTLTAATPASGAHRLPREAWVEMQLADSFVRYSFLSLHAALLLVAVVVCIVHGQAKLESVSIWAAAAVGITLLRYYIIASYKSIAETFNVFELRAFLARCACAWALSGAVWGASMLIFFMRTSIYDQFLCIFILICMGGFAVGTLSSCAGPFKGYVHGLCGTVAATLLFHLVFPSDGLQTMNLFATLVLVVLYWALLLVAGQRLYKVHCANLSLQFDNEELITTLTEKSRVAVEAVATKNRFIASAAHDLRQPVHALELYAGWLAAEPEYVTQIAPKIVRSTQAVADMFNSLFDLAGLDSDPLQVNFHEVDLQRLLKDLEVQYSPVAHERGLRLRTRSQPAIVRADPVLLKRLIGNLMSNALKNTRKGGVLLAMRRRGANGWCINVWDTGVGIAPEHQEAIFQEFYRIPLQGTEEGFGLGLAIVSRLSKALGYPLGMASKVGKGSVFWVEIPSRPAVAGG